MLGYTKSLVIEHLPGRVGHGAMGVSTARARWIDGRLCRHLAAGIARATRAEVSLDRAQQAWREPCGPRTAVRQ